MAPVQFADVDATLADRFVEYAHTFGSGHDPSCVGSEGLATFDACSEPATVALDETGAVIGAASVMLDGYAAEGTSRFRVMHTIDPACYAELLRRVLCRLPEGVDRTFLFLPERAGEVESALAAAGFSISHRAYVLRHRDPRNAPTPTFPSEVCLQEASPAVASDWARVVNVAFQGQPGSYAITAERASELLGRPQVLREGTLLAYRSGVPAGVVLTVADDEERCTAEVETLAVCPASQGKGLGRALLLTAVSSVARKGCRSVSIAVSTYERRAVALYLDLGFRAEDVRVCWECSRLKV